MRRFLALPSQDKKVAVLCASVLPIVHLALRTGARKKVLALLSKVQQKPKPMQGAEHADLAAVAHVDSLVRGVGARLPSNCLSRSLVLQWLLYRMGVESELRIGVARQAGAIRAHAWIEFRGTPVNESPEVLQEYAVFEQEIPLDALG